MARSSEKTKAPVFTVELIGKVIVVQLFEMIEDVGDGNLDPESLIKEVGTLEAYGFDRQSYWYQLRGRRPLHISRTGMYVEIFDEEYWRAVAS